MLNVITETRIRHYYAKGDVVKHLPTGEVIVVEEAGKSANGKAVIRDKDGNEWVLTPDIKPTDETIAKSKTVNEVVKEKRDEVLFAKLADDAIIPSKEDENAGFDIYANFTDSFMVIKPHSTVMIPTKICSAFSDKYVFILKERGSTGTKGMAQRAGIIDSGYRGEWLVPITNTNDIPIIIQKAVGLVPTEALGECIKYPYEKAICQALLVEVPKSKIREISAEELKAIPSKRGEGRLGSSNK
jgi:dUTP pyrophosphatase